MPTAYEAVSPPNLKLRGDARCRNSQVRDALTSRSSSTWGGGSWSGATETLCKVDTKADE